MTELTPFRGIGGEGEWGSVEAPLDARTIRYGSKVAFWFRVYVNVPRLLPQKTMGQLNNEIGRFRHLITVGLPYLDECHQKRFAIYSS